MYVHSLVHPTRCSQGSAHSHTCTHTDPSNPVFPRISTQPHMYTHRSIQPSAPGDQHTATHVHSQVHPTQCSQGSAHSHTCTPTGPSNPVLPGISTQPHMYTHRSIQPSAPGDEHTATHVHSQVHPTRCSQGSAHSHTCTLTGPSNPVFPRISTQPHMYVHSQVHPTRCSQGSAQNHTCALTGPSNPVFPGISTQPHMCTHRSIQPGVPRDQHTVTHVHSQVHPTQCTWGSAHSHTCTLTGLSNPVFPGITTQPHMYTHRSIQPSVLGDQHTVTHIHSQVHSTRCSQGSAHSHTCIHTGPFNPVFLEISTQSHMYTHRSIQPSVPGDQHTVTHVHSQVHPTQCSWGSAHSHTCTLTGPFNLVFLGISTQPHMYTHRSIQPGVPGDQHTATHVHSQVHPTQCFWGSSYSHT